MANFMFRLPSESDIRISANGKIMFHIINNDYDEKYMLVSGEQGSYLEEVAIFRMIRLLNNQKKVLFLSRSKMLNSCVESLLESQNINRNLYTDLIDDWTNLCKSSILTFVIENNFCGYELLLFATNTSIEEFIYLKNIFDRITIFNINTQQTLSGEKNIRNLIEPLNEFTLPFNDKSTYQIYNFARNFVPNNSKANDKNTLDALKKFKNNGDLPEVMNFNSIFELIESIRIITEHYQGFNILVLVSQKNDTEIIYNLLTSYNIECCILNEYSDFTNLKSILITYIDFQDWLPTFDIVLIIHFQAI